MTARKPKAAAVPVQDGLQNALTGAGTSIDRRVYAQYRLDPLSGADAEAAYRTSWLARKIVNIPADDMVSRWRDWQAEGDQIEQLEAEEKRLQVKHKVRRAIILSRIYGGAAIIMGVSDGASNLPLPPTIRAGDLRYLHVVNRHQLSAFRLDTDVTSPTFGEPTAYTLAGATIHPSRVIPFQGVPIPEGSQLGSASPFWGDSVLQAVMDAVHNADLAQQGFAGLIHEAKIDVINIPGLMSGVASEEYEGRLMKRLQIAAMSKSLHRALVLDGEEEWHQKQVSWAGIPDVTRMFLEAVAGAADIPVTRLLGLTPGGLQSSGKGEERDYLRMIEGRREDDLRRALDRLDAVLIPSALGEAPAEVYYTFPSLMMQDAKADADTEKAHTEALVQAVNAGLVSEDVAAKMFKGRVIERGHWPGAEAAYDDADEAGGAIGGDDPDDGDDVTDAAPRTLYVARPVVNRAELQAWATAQGLGELQDDLHVTICYSRQPLDWMKVESDWNQDEAGRITIPPGGVRIVEPLGSKTAVLLFTSSHLSWRHESIKRAGASHDYPDYQPHISLTESAVDLSAVEPYRGKIVLGPERFEEVRA